MTYNAVIHHEQGASVLTIASTGSLVVEAGGTISGAGTFGISGDITYNTITATSLNVDQGGAVQLGDYVQLFFNASTTSPSGLPVNASAGAVFIRSDGAKSNMYINISQDSADASAWSPFILA